MLPSEYNKFTPNRCLIINSILPTVALSTSGQWVGILFPLSTALYKGYPLPRKILIIL